MNILTIKNNNLGVDKEAIKAQKQWEEDGTVATNYLKRVLGDMSQGISISDKEVKKEKSNDTKKP